MSDTILELDAESFDDRVSSLDKPLLVDFWAAWCGPCKSLAPTLQELAAEMEDLVQVAKVDVDRSGELASRFGVRSIPTMIVFKDGKIVDQMVGNAPKAQIRAMLERHLA